MWAVGSHFPLLPLQGAVQLGGRGLNWSPGVLTGSELGGLLGDGGQSLPRSSRGNGGLVTPSSPGIWCRGGHQHFRSRGSDLGYEELSHGPGGRTSLCSWRTGDHSPIIPGSRGFRITRSTGDASSSCSRWWGAEHFASASRHQRGRAGGAPASGGGSFDKFLHPSRAACSPRRYHGPVLVHRGWCHGGVPHPSKRLWGMLMCNLCLFMVNTKCTQ